MNLPLLCAKCRTPLVDAQAGADLVPCPGCGAGTQAVIYPALFRRHTPGRAGEAVLIETEASCYYHPQKKAVLPCEGCGRFVCALCDCQLQGKHFCPACLEHGKKKGKIKNLENERTLYDNIALGLAVYPLLIFYFTIVTAPLALIIAIRYWNAPRSIVHRTKLRLIFAMVVSSLEIAGWGVGFYFLMNRGHFHG